MNKKDLIELIKTLKIDIEDFTVLSSGALVLREIHDMANDLDIAVSKKGLEQLKLQFYLTQKENGWYIVNDKIECVLDNMLDKREKLDGYYLQDINDYLKYLEESNREKDKIRIPKVKKYIKNKLK